MKLIVLILTCLATTPQEDCTRQTAIDVREVVAGSLMECAMAGLTTAASDPRGQDGLWTKIICGRPAKEEHAANGRP
ncbi:hypothetical protein [Methylocella tundrae]|uniref:Ribosomal protein S27 n=1 Tax=Methylocella tundrae TaxID=227605 RepID=A0A4V6IMX6_METTU|nr:hypothetical protein [Methylocella tundrae]WPP04041.1 hypothetical protein SIN04_16510 [Methylocella tundrae]VFU10272.1 conserved protein of unknown function [Methylocella tundrae]